MVGTLSIGGLIIMDQLIVEQYQTISQSTFYAFEIDHLAAISKLVGDDINVRDLHMLSTLSKSKTHVIPSMLAEIHHTSINGVSNRLKLLEKLEYIVRRKSEEDSRKVWINLTDKGILSLERYNLYIDSFVSTIKKQISFYHYPLFIGAMKKLVGLIRVTNNIDSIKLWDDPTHLSSQILTEINNHFISYDYELLIEMNSKIKLRDLFIITELYIQQFRNHTNIKALSVHLLMPYQTLVSKINKFIKEGFILRKNASRYEFSDLLIRWIEKFMSRRVIVYYMTMSHFTDKEKDVIHLMFKLLRQHATSYI